MLENHNGFEITRERIAKKNINQVGDLKIKTQISRNTNESKNIS